MIWLSAESALISISPRAAGPISIPTIRNNATSGIFIFCAANAVNVPIARMSPQESRVCFAISIEAEVSKFCSLSRARVFLDIRAARRHAEFLAAHISEHRDTLADFVVRGAGEA